jgi:hypothetical protein
MANLRQLATFLPFSILFIAPGISSAQPRAPIAEQIGKAYGLDSFGQVEAIRYTFNIPELKLSRTWVWEPKTDTVSYEGPDKVSYEGPDKQGKTVKVTYKRGELSSQSDAIKNDIDPAFVNDHYVLLFPIHVAWDDWATVTDEGIHEMPISKKSARRVLVKYPPQGGYSSGDTWELYVGKNMRLEEFVYHRAGQGFPSIYIATWEGYEKAGPLLFSTDHEGTADGKPLRAFFSDVAVKLTGSDKWINAHSASERIARR